MSAPGPGSVENTAAILRTICGRSADGRSSMCPHDHLGEAAGLVAQVKIAHFRELAAEGHFDAATAEGFTIAADDMEKELTR